MKIYIGASSKDTWRVPDEGFDILTLFGEGERIALSIKAMELCKKNIKPDDEVISMHPIVSTILEACQIEYETFYA